MLAVAGHVTMFAAVAAVVVGTYIMLFFHVALKPLKDRICGVQYVPTPPS